MSLTIAARWCVTFRVQSLARVTMPAARPVRTTRQPNLLAIAHARQLHEELEEMRTNWEMQALLSSRRMF
jgi:hypothetical protein